MTRGLRSLARDFGIGFAAVNDFWRMPEAAAYIELATREFNLLTPENQLKWDCVHPAFERYDFVPAEGHLQVAARHAMAVHGHALVWHQANPAWLTELRGVPSAMTEALDRHIERVVGHFRSRIAIWDVVNEAFQEDGSWRETLWLQALGRGYVERAFVRARAADPAAVLVYNDYNIEAVCPKSDAAYDLLRALRAAGVPVDAVGMQMHWTIEEELDLDSFSANMSRFAALGLRIYLTEMDVRLPVPVTELALQRQARLYGAVMDRCLREPACRAVQFWGLTDRYSWIPGFFGRFDAGLPFDDAGQPKPAYAAVREALARAGR
jgi:endo-1,4-beta-xylanase